MAGGHPNLYVYVANDPIQLGDPSGLRPITDAERKLIRKLYRYRGDVPLSMINASVRDIEAVIESVPPGSKDPASLRAMFWALDQLGNSSWGAASPMTTALGRIASYSNKCNLFVAEAYATGAGVGYISSANQLHGVPNWGRNPFGTKYPASANWLGNPSVNILNLPVTSSPKVGDIVAFANLNAGESGHSTLWCGSGVLIYAGSHAAKIGTLEKNQRGKLPAVFREFRLNFLE